LQELCDLIAKSSHANIIPLLSLYQLRFLLARHTRLPEGLLSLSEVFTALQVAPGARILATMATPSALASRAARTTRQTLRTPRLQSRAASTFAYETGEASGVKFASRELPTGVTTLSVVARAGSRFEPLPGYSDALKTFAFKSTSKRSALRITREIELLGGQVQAYNSRENLVLKASFLQDDLPYFAELLAEVVSKTRYTSMHIPADPSVSLACKIPQVQHRSSERPQ
jgi:hypothetical protein